MKITIDINKNNRKAVTLWTVYTLFFLFNLTLVTESYREYEPIAAERFIVVTTIVGLIGLAAFFIQRTNKKKASTQN